MRHRTSIAAAILLASLALPANPACALESAPVDSAAADSGEAASDPASEPETPAPAEPEAKATAAPKGKPSLTAYYMKGFDDAAWQRGAFDKVAKSWSAASPPALGKRAVVISEISREGKLISAKIGTASGADGWDKAALAAVQKAAPFPKLPASWPASSLEVHWHFALVK